MFRNYLAATLRNLARNKFFSVLNILGLSFGVAAALLVALIVRHWLTFEQWIPGHEQIFGVPTMTETPGGKPSRFDWTNPDVGRWLRDNVRDAPVIRLFENGHALRHGEIEAEERIYWADPETFDVFPFPVVAGDLSQALRRPDGIVLNESMARKYFGHINVVGETIELDRLHTMTVTAVIADMPSNTHLNFQAAFASGLAAISPLARADATPASAGKPLAAAIYARLQSPSDIESFQKTLASFPLEYIPPLKIELFAEPIAERRNVHPYARMVLIAFPLLGALALVIPCINFVNLMTARAARRRVEVGVRKAAGAGRLDLVTQFMGEALIYVLLSTVLAIAIAEIALPYINAYFGTTIEFTYWGEASAMGVVLAVVLVTACAAGIYPSLVLSAFHPVAALRSHVRQAGGRSILRESLVSLQFAILIGLLLGAAVIHQQLAFATTEAIRFETDEMLLVSTSCKGAFKDEVAALPGVIDVACSGREPMSDSRTMATLFTREGQTVLVDLISVEPGFFELYGIEPLAGRTFSRDRQEDARVSGIQMPLAGSLVINESAARKLGFTSPAEAIEKQPFRSGNGPDAQLFGHVIGVVPDLPVGPVDQELQPVVYMHDPNQMQFLNVKLRGRDVPETLTAIDRLWKQVGEPRPIHRVFLQDHIERFYTKLKRQSAMFSVFAAITAGIACMGLLGLSVFAAERRTKEIGVRKAMGADTSDVTRLLLGEFTRPVLWANLIALPIGAYLLTRWLDGFVYRIELDVLTFIGAGVIALLIAWLTVLAHVLRVAASNPVAALRYE